LRIEALSHVLYESFIGTQSLDRFGHRFDHIDKLGRLGRRNPGEMNAAGLNPHVFRQVFKKCELATGVIITFQVMTVAGMSAGHPNAVSPFPQGRQKKLGAHAAGTGDADHPDVGRIRHPADTGQIGGAVAAPVTQKTDDFWFPIGHDEVLL